MMGGLEKNITESVTPVEDSNRQRDKGRNKGTQTHSQYARYLSLAKLVQEKNTHWTTVKDTYAAWTDRILVAQSIVMSY